MAVDNHIFLKNGSYLFLREALEPADDIEAVREIRFSAQAILALKVPATAGLSRTDFARTANHPRVVGGTPRTRPALV
jgi:hypothetical protein